MDSQIHTITFKTQLSLGPVSDANCLPTLLPAVSSFFLLVDSTLRTRGELQHGQEHDRRAQHWQGQYWVDELIGVFRKKAEKVFILELQGGEALKSIESLVPCYQFLVENRADRHSVLVGVGGGAIGDFTGFVAATFLRGVRWWGVPTTLLAQVDSSVGGKTGVNLKLGSSSENGVGKNLIGAFHQPDWVFCDPAVLETLPDRDWISGFGELLKMALLFDHVWFEELAAEGSWLVSNLKSHPKLRDWILKGLIWKGRMVDQDERDLTGARAVLNFGHTLGHVLEGGSEPGHFRHGEAVILGMRAALRLSMVHGLLPEDQWTRLDEVLARFPVPEIPKRFEGGNWLTLLAADKKVTSSVPTFVLLREVGGPVLVADLSLAQIQEAMTWLCANQK